jgi:hypothetical protein
MRLITNQMDANNVRFSTDGENITFINSYDGKMYRVDNDGTDVRQFVTDAYKPLVKALFTLIK